MAAPNLAETGVKLLTGPIRFLIALAAACTMLLVIPNEWQEGMGMKAALDGIRGYVAIGMFGLWMIVAVLTVAAVCSRLVNVAIRKWLESGGEKRLRKLTAQEKTRVARYIVTDRSTKTWPLEDGVVWGLVRKLVLVLASKHGRSHGFDFNLRPWVVTALGKSEKLRNDIVAEAKKHADWH